MLRCRQRYRIFAAYPARENRDTVFLREPSQPKPERNRGKGQDKVLLLYAGMGVRVRTNELHASDPMVVFLRAGSKHNILANAVFKVPLMIRFQRRQFKRFGNINPQGGEVLGDCGICFPHSGVIVLTISAVTNTLWHKCMIICLCFRNIRLHNGCCSPFLSLIDMLCGLLDNVGGLGVPSVGWLTALMVVSNSDSMPEPLTVVVIITGQGQKVH